MGIKAVETLKKKQMEKIEASMGAKTAPKLSDDERSDIDRFLSEFDEACEATRRDHRVPTAFYPSTLGMYAGKCQRRLVYLFRGVVPVSNINARTVRIFATGSSIHEQVQKTIETMGYECEMEVAVTVADPPIRGYVDGVIRLPWNGREIVLEIKSCGESTFIARKKWKKAKDEHFAQANLYAYILGIETIWVVYENKNDQSIDIYEHKANQKSAEKQLKIWRETFKMHKEDKLPKRPYKPESQACGACDLKAHCFGDAEVGE